MCVLCGRDAGRFRHDPFPLAQGICCDACLFYRVLPLRLSVEPPSPRMTREEEEALLAEYAHHSSSSSSEEEPETLQEAHAKLQGEKEPFNPEEEDDEEKQKSFPHASFFSEFCDECDEEDVVGDDD